MSQPRWDGAACRRYPAERFFPIAYQARRADVRAAKAICASCPVRTACLDWALTNPADTVDGIWGGTTPPERERARRTQNERTAAA